MSNFSFSHSVFKRLVSQGHQKVSLCGTGLIRDGSQMIWHNFSPLLVDVPFEGRSKVKVIRAQ